MATEVSSSQVISASHHPQPQPQQAPSSQAQPSQAPQQQLHQTHQSQGGLSSTQAHGTRQYTASTSRPSNRGNRGYNHSNNSRGYNSERNQQGYGAPVKIHYSNSMNGGYPNPSRFPMIRHYNSGATNVTLTPNPSFTLSNPLVPAVSANHFPQNQFSGISNQTTFDEPGHGLLQNPGQSFDPQQQPGQQLVPHRNQMQWNNSQVPVPNSLAVMDQQHAAEMNGGVFGENTIGNYQSQPMQQQQQQAQPLHHQQQPQFSPAQTYFPYHGQFGGGGQAGVNPNMFFPHLNQFYGNPAQNFLPGFGPFQPQFMNQAGYNPYANGAASAATGAGHGASNFICSVCKQQMQASEVQAASEVAATENKASIEPAHEWSCSSDRGSYAVVKSNSVIVAVG